MPNLTPFVVLWSALALVVVALIIYRRTVSAKEDETVHVLSEAAPAQQAAIAHKLDQIDKWGKLLTIIAVVYGLLLAVWYTYETWVRGTTTIGG